MEENEYLGARNRRHFIFPGSSQFKRKPKWIVSAELVETSRLFARNVAEIDDVMGRTAGASPRQTKLQRTVF
ncbi:MAG: oligonucleotide/oligosaccharide-binding fold domain-containing protein [Gammaproteobacteria bacterium]|nr:oligonucleotide/oligosaccharide-binding fold domain-containing protein [Gammaproteobacteria bacterium]